MKQKMKAGNGSLDRSGDNQNPFAGGKFKGFDALNFTTNTTEKQCDLCNPQPETKRRAAKLCAGCLAEGKQLESSLFEHFQQNHKVIRLYRCLCCSGHYGLSKFSVYFGICKKCFANRNTAESTRLTFARQAARNVQKILGGASL